MKSMMNTSPLTSVWLARPRPNPQARLRLFCFPYAGGGALVFRAWADHLPWAVEVCPVQLPGRETRLRESPFTRLEPLVQALALALLPHLDKPFAFFGHSMGAIIGFELAHLLRREHSRGPAHLFVSGRRAPQIPKSEPPIYDLPEAGFLEELRRLNGTPAGVLEHPELRQLIVPILRADFEVVDTYQYKNESPLECPITALGGWQDEEASHQELEAWQERTTSAFALRMLPGDHFFLQTARDRLLEVLSQELRPLCGGSMMGRRNQCR